MKLEGGGSVMLVVTLSAPMAPTGHAAHVFPAEHNGVDGVPEQSVLDRHCTQVPLGPHCGVGAMHADLFIGLHCPHAPDA